MKMKKKIIYSICLISLLASVFALSNHFSYDSSKLTFKDTNKQKAITDSFDDRYALSLSIESNDKELEEKIKLLAKKTTYLLIGEMNTKEESSEHFYKRHKEYENLGAFNYFPRNPNRKDDLDPKIYDESVENYGLAYVSEMAIPQIFTKINELDIVYNSYGDIKVSAGDGLAFSMVTLPNVTMKSEKEDNPLEYEEIKTNLILYYYYMLIDGEYRLWYLYGDTTDNVNEYFNIIEDNETSTKKLASTSFQSDLSTAYNFDKLNKIPESQFTKIYNNNINSLVYLTSYYNNQVVTSANGFYINNGIIVTTWDFIEEALQKAQYIVVKDNNGNVINIDGIITANPETDVALIKAKNPSKVMVTLGDTSKMKVEDPAVTISSKTGISFVIQKGIVISNDNYLNTSIPLYTSDQGSPVFDQNGNVIGMNTALSTSSLISMSINSKILKEIQDKFKQIAFNTIETISFDKLKEEFYYLEYADEKVTSNIPKKIWSKYSKIGKLEDNIQLELLKASYKDGIVSLRYKNTIAKYINSMQLAASFREELVKEGYKEISSSASKYVYKNKEYQIIIMDEFDYLIIVMVKL